MSLALEGREAWLAACKSCSDRHSRSQRSAPVCSTLCSWLWFYSWHVVSDPGQRVQSSAVSWSLCFLLLPIFFPYTPWPFPALSFFTSFPSQFRCFLSDSRGLRMGCLSFPTLPAILESVLPVPFCLQPIQQMCVEQTFTLSPEWCQFAGCLLSIVDVLC